MVPQTLSIDLKFGTKLLYHANYNICENEVKRFNFAISRRFFALLARILSIFKQMTPFLHHNLSIMSILLGQNFKLNKQSQRSSVSYLVEFCQIFRRMLSSFQLLHIIRSCPSRFYEKLTLSTTPENLKAKSWLVFRYHQTNYHFRNHSKKTFFCVQILLKIAHGTTRTFHSNFISKSQILDYNTLKKWKNQIKKKCLKISDKN